VGGTSGSGKGHGDRTVRFNSRVGWVGGRIKTVTGTMPWVKKCERGGNGERSKKERCPHMSHSTTTIIKLAVQCEL